MTYRIRVRIICATFPLLMEFIVSSNGENGPVALFSRLTLLCGDASGKVLRRHTVSDPLAPMGPLPESKRLPLAIELMEGTHCRRAWGGPAPLLPGDLVAPYVCGGAHGLLVHSVKDTLFDQSEPLWTVQTTGPGLLQDGATLPPRQNVAFVYYAGRP